MTKKEKNDITAGSILMSPMFRRFLSPIILTMIGFTLAVSFFAVPYLNNLVYSLEEKSVQTNLINIHKLIEANSLAIEAYKKSVMSAHKRQLKNITLFMETYLKNKYEQVQKGIITEEEAKLTALNELRAFRYGNKDYVWIADYKGFYLSHPDPNMNMEDFSKKRDVFGNYVLTPLIRQAMEKGEGYNSFWWQRLENDLPAEKLAYAKLFPQWEWVMGTGVYLDDLELEIILRKEKMVEELRQILKQISIGETGYMYIFDSWKNIIIHPDTELENTDISEWKNPITGKFLADDLINASKTEENKVAYKWRGLSDGDADLYDKIDWVTHVENFDWYVVASVYTDELTTSSNHLRNRILILAVTVVVLSILIVSFLMGRLIHPIRRLSRIAGQVEAGDLDAKIDIKGKDEISFLAKAFNSMIAQLRDIINDLDQKVLERTEDLNSSNEELTHTVGRLEQHNQEVTQLNIMSEKLHSCHSLEEIYLVVVESLSGLFHEASGILYIAFDDNNNNDEIRPVAKWGKHKYPVETHPLYRCRSIDAEAIVLVDMPRGDIPPCGHLQVDLPYVSMCVPLFGQGEVIGMVNLIFSGSDQWGETDKREQLFENRKRLATTASEHLAMALANMKLREKLQELSIRDGLTGLYNRRYLEESLEREFVQAERSGKAIGIIILDVDFFKQFNDTYGHKTGDDVLIGLSRYLAGIIRKGDILCRYGGEEFVIILPGAHLENSIVRAEVIRAKVERELRINYNEEWIPITISIGVAASPENGAAPEGVLKAADAALYRAKDAGRNRIASA